MIGIALLLPRFLMLTLSKMSKTLLMFSTTIIPTTQKTTFIVLDVLAVLAQQAQPLPYSPLKVCYYRHLLFCGS